MFLCEKIKFNSSVRVGILFKSGKHQHDNIILLRGEY